MFNKATRLNPLPPSGYFQWLGRSYLMTGRYEDAIKTYKRAVNINPEFLHGELGLAAAVAH